MMADGKSGAFLAADRDLVLLDQLTDVFETDWGLMKLNFMMLREGINHVGGCDRLGDAVLPSAGLDQIVEEQCDDVIRLEECAVGIHYAEAVSITVSSDDDAGAGLAHLGFGFVKEMAFWLRRMSA